MTPLTGQSQEPEKPNCCNGSGQRIAGRMPTYLYGLRNGEPAVLMYTESQARFDAPGVTIRQDTDFPASGEVKLHIQPDQPARFALHLRIPPYAQGASIQVNGESEITRRAWNVCRR